jgi:hypothetical protein
MSTLGEECAHRHHDRRTERDNVARTDMAERMGVFGLIFLAAVMPQPDLVLIVEPGLVIVGARGVEYPLVKALGDRCRVVGIDLVGPLVFVVGAQMWVISDDPTPGFEQIVDLIGQHTF